MLGQNPSQPAFFQMVDMESLVPANHRLRQIDAALDLSFVRETLVDCYTPGRGRPSIDPELAVRMMILGVLYDLSDRQLCDEIRMHAGFRWFCRLNFHDPVPDHSTLSRLRNERWAESDLFTRLFEEVLRSCAAAGLIAARALPESDASDEDEPGDPPGNEQAKEPQPEGVWQGHGRRYSNETHVSQTDPDARLYRKGRNQGAHLSYLVHDVIDTKNRIILARRASHATTRAERDVALQLLDEHEDRRERVGIARPVTILSADAGYGASTFMAEVIDRGITPHAPLMAGEEVEAIPTWQRRTLNLRQHQNRIQKVRLARARNRVRLAQRTDGYAVSRRLRIRSEHVFAEAKNRHGLGRARHRSLEKVDRHARLIAAVQNLKRLSRTLWRRAQGNSADSGFFEALLHALHRVLARFLNLGPIHRRIRGVFAATHPITASFQLRKAVHCSTGF